MGNYFRFYSNNMNYKSKTESQLSRKSASCYASTPLSHSHNYKFKRKSNYRNQRSIRKLEKIDGLPLNKGEQKIIKTQIPKSSISNQTINEFQKNIPIKNSNKTTRMVKQPSTMPSRWITRSEVANKIIKDKLADKNLKKTSNDEKNTIVFSDMNNFLHAISTNESTSTYYEEIKNIEKQKVFKVINITAIDLLKTKKDQNYLNNEL